MYREKYDKGAMILLPHLFTLSHWLYIDLSRRLCISSEEAFPAYRRASDARRFSYLFKHFAVSACHEIGVDELSSLGSPKADLDCGICSPPPVSPRWPNLIGLASSISSWAPR